MVERSDLRPHLLVSRAEVYSGRPSALDDRRLRDWLGASNRLRAGGVAFIGFPCDAGVERNGGRPGAAMGPDAFRHMLARMTPDARNVEAFCDILDRSIDLGDVKAVGSDSGDIVADMQRALGRVVEAVLRADAIPFVVGGGHETTFGHYLGCAPVLSSPVVLNWDAHPDVRPLIDGKGHSGSSFRQIMDADESVRYIVAGLNPFSTSAEHVDHVRSRGGVAIYQDEVDDLLVAHVFATLQNDAIVSFDMDAVDSTAAPGVSAPSARGLGSREWLQIAELAGQTPRVRSVDVVELNPRFDAGGRTARLAALTAWRFMRGLGLRYRGGAA